MKSKEVIIHFLSPVPPPDASSCLNEAEKLRAATFRFPADRARWEAFRIQLREVLGETLGIHPRAVPLIVNAFGKPLLGEPFASLHFNLSHCADLALLAVSHTGPIGIDVEPLHRSSELLDCAESFCHPAEIESLPANPECRARSLLHLWCAKEAMLKAWGTGLSHPPDQIHLHMDSGVFSKSPQTPIPGAPLQHTSVINHILLENHLAVLSAPLAAGPIKFSTARLSTPSP